MNTGFAFPIFRRTDKEDIVSKYNNLSILSKNPFQKLFNSDEKPTNNKIYFWDDVTDSSCENLISSIKQVEQSLTHLMEEFNLPFDNLPSIEIYINSPGGCVHSAMAVIDYIQASRFKFTSIIQGCAASAATLISVVCDNRKIYRNSMVLIHELSSGAYGKMFEINDYVNGLRKLMDCIINIYVENTNVSIVSLKKTLKQDIFWSAEEALKLGIVDEIIKPLKTIKYIRSKKYVISDDDLQNGALKLQQNENAMDEPSNIINEIIENKTKRKRN